MKRSTDWKWKIGGTVYLTLVLGATPMTALAYVDPSVSSYLIQAIAGIVVAVGAFAAIYWRRARKKVRDRLGMEEREKKETEGEVRVFEDGQEPRQ